MRAFHGKWKVALLVLALAVLAGCSSADKGGTTEHVGGHGAAPVQTVSSEPAQPTRVLRPDQNGEIQLVAKVAKQEVAPGVVKEVWTYNGSVPGPEIRVKQGETVRVRFKNELPVPTTIHWHGLPVPNAMDGVPGVTQNAVKPGEEFVYEFKATVSGTYMYHSHQDSANQVDRGLYGAIVVEEPQSAYDRDYTLMLDEWMKDDNAGGMDHGAMGGMMHGSGDGTAGQNMEGMHGTQGTQGMQGMHGGSGGAAQEMSMTDMMRQHMKLYDIFTVNGKSGSLIPPLKVKEGERVRLRLINIGTLPHALHLHGHAFTVVARDGQSVAEPRPMKDQLVTVAPGERVDIAFTADNPGTWYLESHDEGTAAAPGMKVAIQYEGASKQTDRPNETAKLPGVDLLNYGKAEKGPFTLDQKYDVEYTMELGTAMGKTGMVFTINGKTFPDTPPIRVKKGDLVKVRLINRSPMDEHPMHLHGHFFQVLSKNGKPLTGAPVIKDTLNVKPGEEYVVAFRADNPGHWMFHCHVLHHAAAGMVTQVRYDGYQSKVKPDPNDKPE
ncbi:multicopper oxidase family protein [Calditerricola yamamurae]